jgi:hypothetical protein
MAIEPWREEPWAPFVRTYEREYGLDEVYPGEVRAHAWRCSVLCGGCIFGCNS